MKIKLLQEAVESLKLAKADSTVELSTSKVNNSASNLVISGGSIAGTPLDEENGVAESYVTTSYTGKSVYAENISFSTSWVQLVAVDGDVDLVGSSTSGSLTKVNASFVIKSNNNVTIKDCVFAQEGRNGVEVCLDASYSPRNVLVDSCSFGGSYHRGLIIYAMQDGGNAVISNCHFKVGNALRLSNRDNTSHTITFSNCSFDTTGFVADEEDKMLRGLVILRDYKSGSAEKENNLFAPNKLTINFVNCTLTDDSGTRKLVSADPETICGTNDDNQLVYIWNNEEKFVAYDKDRYSTVTIK